MSSNTRRAFLLGTGAAIGAVVTHNLANDQPNVGSPIPAPTNDPLVLNDASELSPTKVAKHFVVNEKIAETQISSLRAELKEALAERRPVIASAARHSMGGQSMARTGTTITMKDDWVELDTTSQSYRCGAGTRWSSVIKALDVNGFSPSVMQGNNDFSVASTFSVNAHGLPVPFSGCGSTVKSLKMMLATGELITCSRSENSDIFTAAMGGYGLFGVITELELTMVPNTRLQPTFTEVDPMEFGPRFVQTIKDNSGVQMAYGRLDVTKDRFFEHAMMITYRPTTDQSDLPLASGPGLLSSQFRRILRAQVDNEAAKSRRWWAETELGPWLNRGATTRNTLLNEPVATLEDQDPTRTDILHEYFVSPDKLAAFISACRTVIPSSYQELLNITLRYVMPDTESWLTYAPTDRIAATMLFSQEKSLRAEHDMARMTETLIDKTLALGGSYYLPYRLHARQDQFEKAYPGIRPFRAKKRAMDPSNLFRHAMWDKYMARAYH